MDCTGRTEIYLALQMVDAVFSFEHYKEKGIFRFSLINKVMEHTYLYSSVGANKENKVRF